MEGKIKRRLDLNAEECHLVASDGSLTQQQGHNQATELLYADVVLGLMPSTDPMQMSLLFGGLGRPSW
ncbi:hypothetical protein TNCV_5128351 [Trichonephila clavipes]|nr:hypothetical protein TNCV_5128351 [Trichonephila clavipes]